jgi:plastocyanin
MAGIAAAGILALGGVWPAQAAQVNVSIQGNNFNPPSVTINVNDVVQWRNQDLVQHNVYSDETPELRSEGNLGTNATYTFTFGRAGTFNYYCTIHGKADMSGQVIVQAPATTTTRAPTPTTARPVVTTRATATTLRATTSSAETTTTETLALETTTTEETTTTSGDIAINTEDDGGSNGLAIAGLVVAIMAVLGGGGYAIYRLRAGGA